ncbi:MAG: hypothetical protein LBP75_00630 [Planctomycetota bacterium]|jgi:hypothetical protein|nr:hypothetical protein [Planctomycetota bacterium]
MSNSINASDYVNYYKQATVKPRGVEDVLADHAAAVLERAGVKAEGEFSLDLDENGKVKVLGDVANKDEITAALRGDIKTHSILRMLKPEASAEKPSLWNEPAYVVTLDENQVYDFAEIAARNAGGGDPRIPNGVYDSVYHREVLQEISRVLPDAKGWSHTVAERNGQFVETVQDNFFTDMEFESMAERDALFDYVRKKLKNAGVNPELAKYASVQAQSFNRAAVYQVGIRSADPSGGRTFLSVEEREKITAALSGDKYLWEKLSAAQENFRVKYGYYGGGIQR